ncbi:hypothetical protein CHU98_g7303 [Xylaria longipes]|nr:hypothetical protein CHU98_g7303 [Xylaria longipes]
MPSLLAVETVITWDSSTFISRIKNWAFAIMPANYENFDAPGSRKVNCYQSKSHPSRLDENTMPAPQMRDMVERIDGSDVYPGIRDYHSVAADYDIDAGLAFSKNIRDVFILHAQLSCTLEEVEAHTIGVSSTSPGPEGVTVLSVLGKGLERLVPSQEDRMDRFKPQGIKPPARSGYEVSRLPTRYHNVKCGTPQGSPLSPVLYMLYLAELLKQDTRRRFGYADDLGLYRVLSSLQRNVELLADDVAQLLDWGERNKVQFAPEKCELLHITKRRDETNPPLEIPGRLTLQPVPLPEKGASLPALRWLGVWFDRKLTFKRHVEERVGKATRLSNHIRGLANTKYGPPADMIRTDTRHGTGTRHGLPTADLALEEARYRFAYRLRTVDRLHPLADRVNLGVIERGRGAGASHRYKDLPPGDVVVFTDGSQVGRQVRYAYAVYQNGNEIAHGAGGLPEPSINFDGEATGAWKGLKRKDAAPSAQWLYLNFQAAMETYDVRVKWCPGYCGVAGNERADRLAKQGVEVPPDGDLTPTAYGIKSEARRILKGVRENYWKDMCTRKLSRRYLGWRLDYTLKCHPELTALTRMELHRWLAARTGHGDFDWYHRRFNHTEATLECSCGDKKAPGHFIRYKNARKHYAK